MTAWNKWFYFIGYTFLYTIPLNVSHRATLRRGNEATFSEKEAWQGYKGMKSLEMWSTNHTLGDVPFDLLFLPCGSVVLSGLDASLDPCTVKTHPSCPVGKDFWSSFTALQLHLGSWSYRSRRLLENALEAQMSLTSLLSQHIPSDKEGALLETTNGAQWAAECAGLPGYIHSCVSCCHKHTHCLKIKQQKRVFLELYLFMCTHLLIN